MTYPSILIGFAFVVCIFQAELTAKPFQGTNRVRIPSSYLLIFVISVSKSVGVDKDLKTNRLKSRAILLSTYIVTRVSVDSR